MYESVHQTSCDDHSSILDPGPMDGDCPQGHSTSVKYPCTVKEQQFCFPLVFGQDPLRIAI